MEKDIDLKNYDIIIFNSSAGKDSLVALLKIASLVKKQSFPKEKVFVSHQDLGAVEWFGTRELVKKQADIFGFTTVYSHRLNKNGKAETFLEYVIRRGKWPSKKQRWCTSDFKRGPGLRVVTKLCKNIKNAKVLYVFGFRHEESPERAKKSTLVLNSKASTKVLKDRSRKRTVWEYCPILTKKVDFIWRAIKFFKLPYHFAYDLGMPRLSCCFCIFSPFDALIIAGYHNYELLLEYIKVEILIQHNFRKDFSLIEVKNAIDNGYKPKKINNWIM